ncbi:MAG: hypothetical protein HY787_09325 [Deltaproteobacteria bacterium]|nr:hypothetical protein [Deltaproteobacteria bacterium]
MKKSGVEVGCILGILCLLFSVCIQVFTGLTPAFSEEKDAEEYKFDVSET